VQLLLPSLGKREKTQELKLKPKKKKKGKTVETEKKEVSVPSFFDIFAAEESNVDGLSDLPQQAEFIRDDLLCNSLEYFLDIYESDEYDDDEEEEEDDEDDESDDGETKKGKKKGGDSKKAEKCKNQ
jgi:hypothetical protein